MGYLSSDELSEMYNGFSALRKGWKFLFGGIPLFIQRCVRWDDIPYDLQACRDFWTALHVAVDKIELFERFNPRWDAAARTLTLASGGRADDWMEAVTGLLVYSWTWRTFTTSRWLTV